MKAEGRDQGLGEIAPAMLEAVPYVGQLVGTLARMALEESERAQIERCLIAALHIDDGEHKRKLRNRLHNPFGKGRALRAAQRQAALDLAGDVDLMAVALAPAELPTDSAYPKATSGSAEVPRSMRKLAQFAYETARKELDDALDEEAFVPWPNRLASALTAVANQRWKDLEKSEEGERRRWARLVMNDRDARPGDVTNAALIAFGQRVGLRFEVSLVRNPKLASIVERMDLCDHRRAEISTLVATQGIRRALLLLLLAALALFVLLAGEAGGGHLAADLFEAI